MVTETIPLHLQEYITEQDPKLYTSIDQALWRYFMRTSKKFFRKHAHSIYLDGLDATGISEDYIPLVSEMDAALRNFGWRAVAINGFIPPSIFLEFQSLKILAIACDIRKVENIGYTPSPDILHEAAGHAPILADPGYRKYLESYGEVARNAIISKYDLDLYEAIFKLSALKENPFSTPQEIQLAQTDFELMMSKETKPSEAALMTRMAWWTNEYGLVGPLGNPQIYGAGLLSSLSESYECLKPSVKKIPFNLEAVLTTSYDITQPQPQLFVAKNFDELTESLDRFSNLMAYRRGGTYALEVAQEAANTVTVVFDSGVQLTGIVSTFEKSAQNEEVSITLTGSKQLSFANRAESAFSTRNLPQEIFLPLFDRTIFGVSSEDIQRKLHGSGLVTKTGLRIQGRLKKELSLGGMGRVLLLEQVKFTDESNNVFYEENIKTYPLILASKIISVFGGAADRAEFAVRNTPRSQKVKQHETSLNPANAGLNELYRKVNVFRTTFRVDVDELQDVISVLNQKHAQDWLLRLELLELFQELKPSSITTAHLRNHLVKLTEPGGDQKILIQRGLELL